MKPPNDRVPIWNVWWTLTLLAAAFGVLVAILEALEVFSHLGIALGILSVLATIIFGVSASTRSSVRTLDHRFVGLAEQMAGVDRHLMGFDGRLAEVDEPLGAFLAGQGTTNEALGRIEELLRTRLPAA
jgi:hypothetical protein